MPTASTEKENDPTFGRLKRLSSIASITIPLSQFASKLRRPSTAFQPTIARDAGIEGKKTSFMARGIRQSSSNSNKRLITTTPAASLSSEQPIASPPLHSYGSNILKSKTTSNLPVLSSRQPLYKPSLSSQSNTNLVMKSTVLGLKENKSTDKLTATLKENNFPAVSKSSASALPRFHTQPSLLISSSTKGYRPGFARTSVGNGQSEGRQSTIATTQKPFTTPKKPHLKTACESMGTQKHEASEALVTTFQTSWQSMTPSGRQYKVPRKSIEELYEELQLSPRNKTPTRTQAEAGPRRSLGGSITHHQLLAPLATPLPRRPAEYTDTRSSSFSSTAGFVRKVSQSQPPAYWSGRYMSLNDRLLNEAIEACSTTSNPFSTDRVSKGEEDLARIAGAAHGVAHAQRILSLLYAACVTEEASSSLRAWQVHFSHLRQMPTLAAYKPANATSCVAGQERDLKRESTVLQPMSGNGHRGYVTWLHDVRQRNKDVSETTSAETFTSEIDATGREGDQRSARTARVIHRLLSGGRKVSGKASVLGGVASMQNTNVAERG